ncbi:MAG: GAF domain-containing protein [Anaerolinea sp.]|nr:GAF domain-containing protein [Anaerolinea sp.]
MLTSPSSELLLLRKRYMQVLALSILILSSIGMVAVLVNSLTQRTLNVPAVVVQVVALVLSFAWLYLLFAKRYGVAGTGILLTLIPAYLISQAQPPVYLLTGTLVLLTAAVLARRELFVFSLILVIGRLVVATLLVASERGTLDIGVFEFVLPASSFLAFSLVVRFFTMNAQKVVEQNQRTAQTLNSATIIGRQIVQQTDAEEIMRRTVNFIRDRFAYYHVQIFLLNDMGDQAVLRASTGDIGYQLLQRRHQLTVGSQSVIGQAVLRGEPVLVADTSREAVYFRNELLPNTRSEFAIPLKDGDQVFGTLDIQSTIPNSFTPIDRQALEVIGDILAVALRDVRLLNERTRLRSESARLSGQLETLTQENDRLNREVTRATWEDYLGQHTNLTGVDLRNDEVIPAADWTPDLTRATRQGETIAADAVIAVPVMLRGEVIGAIEVERGTGSAAETVEIAQAVAQRLAVSLESARLYEETRQAAREEQQINEIVARYGTTTSVDELLRITLMQLGETLGAQGGSIRLGSVEDNANGGSA